MIANFSFRPMEKKEAERADKCLLGRFVLLGVSAIILFFLDVLGIVKDGYLVLLMIILFSLSIIFGPYFGEILKKIFRKN